MALEKARTGWLALTLVALLAGGCGREPNGNTMPPLNPEPGTPAWKRYPYELVSGDPRLDFPGAEGRQRDMDSDTWFLEGVLQGEESGRRFAFVALFILNRVGGLLPVDFYSLAFYDLDAGDYGTFTEYGLLPPGPVRLTASAGFLDLSFLTPYGLAAWTTRIDTNGYLEPFAYEADLPGVDHVGRRMRLVTRVDVKHPPVPVGADAFNGVITVYGQEKTYSYFQTGLQFSGVLTWGDHSEPVTGRLGHIDRQMFPAYAGVESGLDGRNRAHEWRTFFLDDGTTISSWRQFDRLNRNAEVPYSGATVLRSDAEAKPFYVDDIEYEVRSYVRMPEDAPRPLFPGRSDTLYFPDRYRIRSASLGLDLLSEPLVAAPMLSLPIEYMHGPVGLTGTIDGQPIQGLGSFERTLGLYRDFELVDVLRLTVAHLPGAAFQPGSVGVGELLRRVARVADLIDRRRSGLAKAAAMATLKPEIEKLAEPYRAELLQMLADLVDAVGRCSTDGAPWRPAKP